MSISAEMQLDILLRLGKTIAKEHNLDILLDIIHDLARDILDCDRSSIFLVDKMKSQLWTKVAHGVDEIRIPMDKGVAGFAFLSGEIQIVMDAYNDFRFNKEIDKDTKYVTKSILAVPLLNSKNDVLGVFQALNKREGVFTGVDAELLLLISNYVSAALENALLFKEIKASRRKLIYKLSTAAEFKDEDTSKHTQRVGHYSAIIAQKCEGIDEEMIEKLRLTSPMHDAGKIGIDDNVLKKPGKLTDMEFAHMREHCLIGYDLLYDEDDDLLQMAATIAKEHHEKYNGNGYPHGLKGEEISIYSRITAIADVFDALTSKRPYKEPWSFEKAMELLKSERGEHFDPQLIDIFLSQVDEVMSIYEKLKD